MAKEIYIATIQVAINANSVAEAEDTLSEGMPDVVMDWQYLPLGGQYCLPSKKLIQEPYEEGSAFE